MDFNISDVLVLVATKPSANTLAFLLNAFRPDFIQHIEVAVLTNNDNRDCCKEIGLVFIFFCPSEAIF